MTKVRFLIQGVGGGTEEVVDAHDHESVMQVAVRSGVPGVIGECGGELSCATCHVLVEPDVAVLFVPMSEDEDDMLDLVDERSELSRLSCQLRIRPDLPDVEVTVPRG